MRPVVYTTVDYLRRFHPAIKSHFDDDLSADGKRFLIFLQELIFEKAEVWLDLDEKLIREALIDKKVTNSEVLDPLLIELIQLLNKNGQIPRSCKKEMSDFLIDPHSILSTLRRPDYILANEAPQSNFDKGINILLLNSLADFFGRFKVRINRIPKGRSLIEEQLFGFLKSHSAIVQDPYLFSRPKEFKGNTDDFIYDRVDFMKSFFNQILIKGSGIFKPVVTIITSCGSSDDPAKKRYGGNLNNQCSDDLVQKKIIDELNDDMSSHFIIEHFTLRTIHDRFILTNTSWLTSEQGFKEFYKEETKNLIIPLGFFHDVFVRKIESVASNILNAGKRSNNPLLKGKFRSS